MEHVLRVVQITPTGADAIYRPPNVRFGKLRDIPGLAQSMYTEGQETAIRLSTDAPEGYDYTLVYGNRRLAAAAYIWDNPEKFPNHFTLRAEVQEGRIATDTPAPTVDSAVHMLRQRLIENAQRSDMTVMDYAVAIQQSDEAGIKRVEQAKLLGRSSAWITITAKFLELSEPAQQGLDKGLLAWRDGRTAVLMEPGAKRDAFIQKLLAAATKDGESPADAKDKKKKKKQARKDAGVAQTMTAGEAVTAWAPAVKEHPELKKVLGPVAKWLTGEMELDTLVQKLLKVVAPDVE